MPNNDNALLEVFRIAIYTLRMSTYCFNAVWPTTANSWIVFLSLVFYLQPLLSLLILLMPNIMTGFHTWRGSKKYVFPCHSKVCAHTSASQLDGPMDHGCFVFLLPTVVVDHWDGEFIKIMGWVVMYFTLVFQWLLQQDQVKHQQLCLLWGVTFFWDAGQRSNSIIFRLLYKGNDGLRKLWGFGVNSVCLCN